MTLVDRRKSSPWYPLAADVAAELREFLSESGLPAFVIAKRYRSVRAGDVRSILDGTWCERGLGLKRLLSIGEAAGVTFDLRRVA